MTEPVTPLPQEFICDGRRYTQIIRSKHWVVVKEQSENGDVRYVASPISVRDGYEVYVSPRFNEIYSYDFPTEAEAIDCFLQSRDIVIA
jgi:hypothetical protein